MKDFILEKTVPLRLMGFNENANSIEIMNFEFKFSMVTASPSGSREDIEQAQTTQSISFSKAITFLEGVVDNSLYLTLDTPDELFTILLGAYENNIILLPDCAESYLMSALHSKLNAIVHKNTLVERLELTDIDNKLTYTFVMTDNERYDDLPADSEWLGDFSVWDTAWWNRNDVSTLDRMLESQEEYDETMANIDLDQLHELNTAVLDEIEDNIMGMLRESGAVESPQGELVEVNFTDKDPKFKPKLV